MANKKKAKTACAIGRLLGDIEGCAIKEIPVKRNRGDFKLITICKGEEPVSSAYVLDGETSIAIHDMRAHTKGGGYGKKLLEYIMSSHPHLHHISTDGFTEQGAKAFRKVMQKHDFRMTDWIHGPAVGIGQAWRQDVIDQIIEKNEKGHRTIFHIDPSFHSRNKGEK